MEKFTHGEKEKMENWVMEIDGEFYMGHGKRC
jgi:hypothetical protein